MLMSCFPQITCTDFIMMKHPTRSSNSLGKRVKRIISESSSDLKTFFCHPFEFSKEDHWSTFSFSFDLDSIQRSNHWFTWMTIGRTIIVRSLIFHRCIIFQRSVLIIGLKHSSSFGFFVTFYSIFLFNSSKNSILVGILTYANKREKANGKQIRQCNIVTEREDW